MIKTLVSIEVDLASSMAVRLACQLGGLMEMEIHPVYVRESPPLESAIGAGWASRTWEREMIEQGRAEISEWLTAEKDFCPVLREPRVIYGDQDAELLKITQAEPFDLYVEGAHFAWTPTDIYKRLHSRLYQRFLAPVVLVRALRRVNHVLVLCLDVKGTEALTGVFQTIWKNSSVPLTLAYPAEKAGTGSNDGLRAAVARARGLLEESGCTVSVLESLTLTPTPDAEETLKDYAVVAIALERGIKKEDPELQWLNLVKTSSLLVFH